MPPDIVFVEDRIFSGDLNQVTIANQTMFSKNIIARRLMKRVAKAISRTIRGLLRRLQWQLGVTLTLETSLDL